MSLNDYRDVYVAACGVVLMSFDEGGRHERRCTECQRELRGDTPKEDDDDGDDNCDDERD